MQVRTFTKDIGFGVMDTICIRGRSLYSYIESYCSSGGYRRTTIYRFFSQNVPLKPCRGCVSCSIIVCAQAYRNNKLWIHTVAFGIRVDSCVTRWWGVYMIRRLYVRSRYTLYNIMYTCIRALVRMSSTLPTSTYYGTIVHNIINIQGYRTTLVLHGNVITYYYKKNTLIWSGTTRRSK